MTARGACAEHTRAPPALRRHGGVTPHSGHGDKRGRAQEQPFAGPAPAGTSAALTSLKPQPPTDELPDALSSKCNRITTRPSPAPPPVYKIPIRVCFRIKPRHSHTTPAYTCPTAQTLEQNRTKRVNFGTRTRRLGPRTGPRQERRAAGAPALGQLVGTPPDSGPLHRPGLVSGEPQALGLHSPRLQLCTGRPPRRATPKACPTQRLTPTPTAGQRRLAWAHLSQWALELGATPRCPAREAPRGKLYWRESPRGRLRKVVQGGIGEEAHPRSRAFPDRAPKPGSSGESCDASLGRATGRQNSPFLTLLEYLPDLVVRNIVFVGDLKEQRQSCKDTPAALTHRRHQYGGAAAQRCVCKAHSSPSPHRGRGGTCLRWGLGSGALSPPSLQVFTDDYVVTVFK